MAQHHLLCGPDVGGLSSVHQVGELSAALWRSGVGAGAPCGW